MVWKNSAQLRLQVKHLMTSEKEGNSVDCKWADLEREEFVGGDFSYIRW